MTDEHTKRVWSGPCIGGPMAGRDGSSRFPKGFLLVDRPTRRVWHYDYVPDTASPSGGAFQVRIEGGVELIDDPDAPKNRYRAAEEAKFDVRAMDWTTP